MSKGKKISVYDLKYYYQANNNGHFFDRKTMKWFGDTMRNFGLSGPMEKVDRHGEKHTVYYLYRRDEVKVFSGPNVSKGKGFYFDAVTYKQIFGIDD